MILAVLCSCGQRNITEPVPEARPRLVFNSEKIGLEGGEYLFRQEVRVDQAKDRSRYAFRIETTDGEMPEGLACDAQGFIYHYLPGADTSVSLDSAQAQRGIWTPRPWLRQEFRSTQGRLGRVVSKVEVLVKDSTGRILRLTSGFRTDRVIGTWIHTDFYPGSIVGQGVEVSLQEQSGDIYVEGMYADHFMFRLNILNADLQPLSYGEWHNSANGEDIRQVRLNTHSDPPLLANEPGRFTQFEAYVVTRQGLTEDTPKSCHFQVSGNFQPQPLIYPQLILANGMYHYSSLSSLPSPAQQMMNPYLGRTWLPPYSWENNNIAVNSADLRIHLAWGWNGQYGHISTFGTNIITNNPFEELINECVDLSSGQSYYSAITHLDLRLNGQPFPNMQQFGNTTLVTHTDGTVWRRIQNLGPQSHRAYLGGLPNGVNTFEVYAVDLQDNLSAVPATYSFMLAPFVPAPSRSGVLVVDCDLDQASFSPEAIVDPFYAAVCPTQYGAVQTVDIESATTTLALPPSLMQNYKYLLWHADNPARSLDLVKQSDALRFYLDTGGKVILSATHQLSSALEAMLTDNPDFCGNYLGITSADQFGFLAASLNQNPYFVGADAVYEYWADIYLNLATPFNQIVALRHGLSSVTWFDSSTWQQQPYLFGCKPVNAAVSPPSQQDYDFYSSKFVGVRKYGGSLFVFGFPLSYMDQPGVQAALATVFDWLGN
jgi:hypothetical protein